MFSVILTTEIEKIARDHENAELKKNNVANPANVSNEVGQILTPRAQMAHAILENARSDFAAIQEDFDMDLATVGMIPGRRALLSKKVR